MLDLNAIVAELVDKLETAGFTAYSARGTYTAPSVVVGFPETIKYDTSKYASTVDIPLMCLVPANSVEDAQRTLNDFVSCGSLETPSVIDFLRSLANTGESWRALRILQTDGFGQYEDFIGCAITVQLLA